MVNIVIIVEGLKSFTASTRPFIGVKNDFYGKFHYDSTAVRVLVLVSASLRTRKWK